MSRTVHLTAGHVDVFWMWFLSSCLWHPDILFLLAAGLNNWRGLLDLGIVSEVEKWRTNQQSEACCCLSEQTWRSAIVSATMAWVKSHSKDRFAYKFYFFFPNISDYHWKLWWKKWHIIIIIHYHFIFFLILFWFWVLFVILFSIFRRFVVYFFYIFRLLYQI